MKKKEVKRQTTDNRRPAIAGRTPAGDGVVRNAAPASPSVAVATKRINRLRNAQSLTSGALEQTNPLRGLTLARAVALMEETLRGEYAIPQWTLWHVEQTDADLFALESRRTSALMEMDWDIKEVSDQRSAVDGQPENKKLAKDQAAVLRAAYERIENLNDAIEDMAGAFVRGFSIAQFESDPSDQSDQSDRSAITRLGCYDAWNIVRQGLNGDFYFNPDGRAISWRSLPAENRIDPANHIIYTPRKNLMRIALYKFIRMNLSQKDWDAFIEIYGLPSSFIIMPPNVPTEKEAAYEAAALEAAEGGGGALPNGADVKFATEPRGVNPFKDHLAYLQQQLILAGTGGLLTMLSMPTGIGDGASGQHEDTFKTIARGEAKKISEGFQKQFDKKILDAAFPGQPVLAYFELAAKEEQDVGEIIKHALELSQAGYQMDSAELSEKTGYTITLAAPAPVAPTEFRGQMSEVRGQPAIAGKQVSAAAGNPDAAPTASDTTPAPASPPEVKKPAIAGPASASVANQESGPPSVSAAVAATLGVRSDLLTPFFASIEVKAQDKTLTDAELLDAIEAMAKSLPELMTETSVQTIAKIIEATLAGALVAGIIQTTKAQ